MDQAVDISFTSGYSIRLAQALNPGNPSKPMRAAAELWHYLCYKHNDALGTQKMEARDGYFYVKFEWWEKITSYSAKTFSEACALLKKAGLIDYKKMYILGSHVSCNHFKLLYPTWELAPNNQHFEKPELNPLPVSDLEVTSSPYNIEENIEERGQGFDQKVETLPPSEPSALGAPQATPASLAPICELVENSLSGVFGVERKSVRPDKKDKPGRQKFAVAQAVVKAWGFKTPKISARLADLVDVWLKAGFTSDQIIEAGNLMKKSGDKYWESATPIQMLGENGLLWYQQNRKNLILKTTPHMKLGDKYYQINPSTGHPIKEIEL